MVQTIRSVGVENWAAACSDSTNVTKAARREVVNVITTMLNLRDAIHHLHNTIGDVNKLPDFKFVSGLPVSIAIFRN
jgi:hypothetical protein